MLSLQNKVILSTRPLIKEDRLKLMLEKKGCKVLDLPLIKTECITGNDSISKVLSQLDHFDWIIFTSKNGIQCFYDLLSESNLKCLNEKNFAVMGKGTNSELFRLFSANSKIEASRSSGDLLKKLHPILGPGNKVLLIQGELADRRLQEGLSDICDTTRLDVYKTIHIEQEENPLIENIKNNECDLVIFTSPSAFQNFLKLAVKMHFPELKGACLGPTTADEMNKSGHPAVLVAPDSDIESFVSEIEKYFGNSL